MYLETMEKVLGGMNKVILDGVSGGEGGQGVVPFLPLNELSRMAAAAAAAAARRDQLMNASHSYRSRRVVVLARWRCLRCSSWTSAKRRWSCSSVRSRQVKETPDLGFKMPLHSGGGAL